MRVCVPLGAVILLLACLIVANGIGCSELKDVYVAKAFAYKFFWAGASDCCGCVCNKVVLARLSLGYFFGQCACKEGVLPGRRAAGPTS